VGKCTHCDDPIITCTSPPCPWFITTQQTEYYASQIDYMEGFTTFSSLLYKWLLGFLEFTRLGHAYLIPYTLCFPPGLPLYAFLLVSGLLGHVSLLQFILCIPLIFLPDGLCLPLCPHYAFHLPPNLCLPLVPGPARPSWSVVRLLPHVFLVSVPESWFDPISHICLMYSPMPWSGLLPHVLVWTSASCLPHVCLMSASCLGLDFCLILYG
jgi:hypothetical protein